MTAVGVDVQETTTADLLAISRDIMCLSCSAPIVMNFDTMVGPPRKRKKNPCIDVVPTPQIQHSHRHDDMQFKILADEELVKFSDYLFLPGVTAKLMTADDQTKEWRSSKYFGCKHCIPNPRKSSAIWI